MPVIDPPSAIRGFIELELDMIEKEVAAMIGLNPQDFSRRINGISSWDEFKFAYRLGRAVEQKRVGKS